MPVRVGISPPLGEWTSHSDRARFASLAADAEIDHIFVADHVCFRDGRGMDGLIQAASLLALDPRLDAYVGVYLLALRHPVAVARQLATIAESAPGRLTFGVGVGGDDRAEIQSVGVDPATRGRRTDEALGLLRRLLAGERVLHDGEFYQVGDARILPSPEPPIPIVIGGRSGAALRRTGRFGDGWLAAWCSPSRVAQSIESIATAAADVGREYVAWQHGFQGWVGLGSDVAAARRRLAGAMEAFYHVPFDKFERYSPAGTPGYVASRLEPYLAAGCTTFNLAPVAASVEDAIAGVGEVKRLLERAARSDRDRASAPGVID